jgi:hypothetical protein
MVARAEPPPFERVPGAELGGVASGAPPAPAEERGPPPPPVPAVPVSAVPWEPPVAGAPAPEVAAPTPRGLPAGAQQWTQTQPIKPEAGGGTVTVTGETPEKLDLERRRKEIDADVDARFGKIPETKDLKGAYIVRGFQNDLLNEFTPEERASYLGYVTPYLKQFWEGNDPRYRRFLALNDQIRAAMAESGAPKEALEGLPSGMERTPAEYENALRVSVDATDKLITAQGTIANMHVANLNPKQQQAVITDYMSRPGGIHYGPYPWDPKTGAPLPTQTTTTTPPPTSTTSPFLVDRVYTVQPPAQ